MYHLELSKTLVYLKKKKKKTHKKNDNIKQHTILPVIPGKKKKMKGGVFK